MIPRHRRSGHGSALQRIRRAHGLTLRRMGSTLGVSDTAIRTWETDARPLPVFAALAYAALARRARLPWIAVVLEAA